MEEVLTQERIDKYEYDLMKYKLANDALNIALWDMDIVGGDPFNPHNIFTWSQEFRYMLGFSDENDFPNVLQSWSDRLHPEDKEMTINAFVKHMTDHTGKTPYDIEYRLILKDGRYRYFHAFGNTLRNSEGIPLRVAGAVMDVTNRKQAEEETREANERTRLLLDSMPLTCHLWNKNFQIFDCNEENIRLFNLKNKQDLMDHFYNFSPKYQPDGKMSSEKAVEMIQKAFDDGGYIGEWMHQTSDGSPLPTEITLVRVPYAGDYVVAGYARDLREHKKMMAEIHDKTEKLEAAMKEAQVANDTKSNFLANISHEMRTPLNAVIGLSRLTLEMEGLDEEVKKNLEKIYNSGSTLLNIVNDILDISKIEAGKLELIPNEYCTPSLINDTVAQNFLRIGEKPIGFNLDIDAGTPARLYGDELRVKQVLNNLLSNAFKYTKEGTVELGIRSEHEKGDDTVWVTVWIRDTGMGIRPEDIKKLFSDYSQVNTKANRKIEGTGLGLAITKKMIDLMEGTINVESEYGKGSVFTVRFKQKFVTDDPIGESIVNNLKSFRYSDENRKQNSRIVRVKMPYAKVLVVDDNMTNLDVTKGLLKPYEIQIDCVTSGQDAINAILREDVKYNAVFMDHMMPEMDGIEATQHIREIDTDYTKNIPIIALTANAIAGNDEMFLSKGFQAFLSKPIDIMQLDSIIKRWVRDKSKEKTLPSEPTYETQKAPDAAASSELPEIPGIDTKKGLNMLSGNMETYLSILRSYAKNTPAIIEKLRDVTAENLPRYAIHVHGLKGSSANIGAEDIREKGLDLEMKSKAGDLKSVLALNDAFLHDVEIIVNNIRAWFDKYGAKTGKPRLDTPAPVVLAKLHQSLLDCDMNSIDDIMDELDGADYGTNADLIPWLKEKITESDFDDAAKKITDILERG